jgi:hypothetical protein
MNELERVVRRDLERLIGRLATSVPEGAVGPALRSHVDGAEARLAAAYAALIDDYAAWQLALDEVENLWALAVWRAAFADEPAAPPAVARAA